VILVFGRLVRLLATVASDGFSFLSQTFLQIIDFIYSFKVISIELIVKGIQMPN
jgi:hypothetical protein